MCICLSVLLPLLPSINVSRSLFQFFYLLLRASLSFLQKAQNATLFDRFSGLQMHSNNRTHAARVCLCVYVYMHTTQARNSRPRVSFCCLFLQLMDSSLSLSLDDDDGGEWVIQLKRRIAEMTEFTPARETLTSADADPLTPRQERYPRWFVRGSKRKDFCGRVTSCFFVSLRYALLVLARCCENETVTQSCACRICAGAVHGLCVCSALFSASRWWRCGKGPKEERDRFLASDSFSILVMCLVVYARTRVPQARPPPGWSRFCSGSLCCSSA